MERNDCGWHFWTFSGSVREVIVIFLLSTVKFYLLFLGELVLRIVCFWGSPVGAPGWAPSKHCSLYRSACALPPCLALWHSVKMFKVSHHENRINLGYKTLYGNLIINLTNQNTFSSFFKQIVKKQVTYNKYNQRHSLFSTKFFNFVYYFNNSSNVLVGNSTKDFFGARYISIILKLCIARITSHGTLSVLIQKHKNAKIHYNCLKYIGFPDSQFKALNFPLAKYSTQN